MGHWGKLRDYILEVIVANNYYKRNNNIKLVKWNMYLSIYLFYKQLLCTELLENHIHIPAKLPGTLLQYWLFPLTLSTRQSYYLLAATQHSDRLSTHNT